MASDFDRAMMFYGNEEHYLICLKEDGPSVVTRGIMGERLDAIRSRNEDAFQALLRDSRYIDLLVAATTSRSFEQARKYIEDALSTPKLNQDSVQSSAQQVSRTDLARSFKRDYVGNAHEGLYQHLSLCNAEFCKSRSKYYGKFCSIVQSSGTGKSRTIIRLMQKKSLGIYMNIRSKDEANSYPPRDSVPADILAKNLDCSPREYANRCIALLTAIFTVLRWELTSKHEGDVDPQVLIQAWSKVMCEIGSPERSAFFEKVKREYDRVRVLLGGNAPTDGSIQQKRVQESEVIAEPELVGEAALHRAYSELVRSFWFFDNSHGPKLVIAIDEACKLGKMQGEYRPDRILCRIIGNLTQDPVSNWVLFASTTSKVADFSVPTRPIYSSLRIRQLGNELFPVYSLFDWDQLATPLSGIDPEKVAYPKNIVGFGRPLWSSLPLEAGILEMASRKLCRNKVFDAQNSAHSLAVLGQRLCLDICFGHPRSMEFQVEAVSGHLRVCSKTTEDKVWQTTLYPSEPLLSCAASTLLHSEMSAPGEQETILTLSLGCLSGVVETGMVEAGKKGELPSRIVYLCGKDLYVRSPKIWSTPSTPNSKWSEQELADCRALGVTGYLEFLFGETTLSQEVKELFQDWYINFSHWVSMSQRIHFSGSKIQSKLGMEAWLARLWCRTSAVQGYHNQRAFDQLIPMYRLGSRPKQQSGGPAEPHASRVSYILISNQNRTQRDATNLHLSAITPKHAHIPDLGQPYIAIHAELRVENEEPTFTLIHNQSSTPSLRIYAPGVNPKTYSFLKAKELLAARDILKKMLGGPREALDHGPITESLRDQLRVSDPDDKYME